MRLTIDLKDGTPIEVSVMCSGKKLGTFELSDHSIGFKAPNAKLGFKVVEWGKLCRIFDVFGTILVRRTIKKRKK